MVENEPVLVIPEVLALLGDNPMQSEFACHIGLRGKLFCRACWVKGTDAMDRDDDDRDQGDGGSVHRGSEAGSEPGSDVSDAPGSDVSDTGNTKKPKKGKGKKIRETMSAMVERVKSFMKAGRPHFLSHWCLTNFLFN
jgi:hypothetical protein